MEKVLISESDSKAYQQVLNEVRERHYGQTGEVISISEQDIHVPRSVVEGLQDQETDIDLTQDQLIPDKVSSDLNHAFEVRSTLRVIKNLFSKDAGNAFEEIKKAA